MSKARYEVREPRPRDGWYGPEIVEAAYGSTVAKFTPTYAHLAREVCRLLNGGQPQAKAVATKERS